MIKREKYLKKIRGFYDNELIKIITGMRRCGKSILLKQIVEELKEKGIDDEHIVFMNLEDIEYIELLNVKALNNYIKSKIKDDKKYYLFFDEIQNVPEFELVINSFRSTLNVSIFLTGSNGKLLSGELSTHLSGRYISFKMLPFSFAENCEVKNITNPTEKDLALYIEWGGMPQLNNINTNEEKKMFLQDLYNSIILKDIIERSDIKDVNLLNRIIQFLLENIGGLFSANSIKNFLKQEMINTSVDRLLNYIDNVTSSMLINKVNRYDIRGKRVMSTQEKYYMADLRNNAIKKIYCRKFFGWKNRKYCI